MLGTSHHTFDSVYVIESTTDPERTGRALVDQVLMPFRRKTKLADPQVIFEVPYHTPRSGSDFLTLLDLIAAETSSGSLRPILHLEIHGTDDGTALYLANGDTIPWKDLTDHLLAINIASRNNLVVVLAVCFGEQLMQVFPRRAQVPVFGLVGPTENISFGRFEAGFRAFYECLLETGDGDRAVAALNAKGDEHNAARRYVWHSAEGAFRVHFHTLIVKMFGTADARRAQVEDAVNRLMLTDAGRGAGAATLRRRARAVVRTAGREAFALSLNRYLMLDLFPEQDGRFSLTYENSVPTDRL
jgi:hypothetical protein